MSSPVKGLCESIAKITAGKDHDFFFLKSVIESAVFLGTKVDASIMSLRRREAVRSLDEAASCDM